DDTRYAVEKLLSVGRPRAAFSCLRMRVDSAEPDMVYRILATILEIGEEQPAGLPLDPYEVAEAFDRLDQDKALPLERKAVLEFAYLDVLGDATGARRKRGIPNLTQYIIENP